MACAMRVSQQKSGQAGQTAEVCANSIVAQSRYAGEISLRRVTLPKGVHSDSADRLLVLVAWVAVRDPLIGTRNRL